MFQWLAKLLLHRGHCNDDGLSLRTWFAFFLSFLGGLAALVLVSLYAGQQSGSSENWQKWWLLGLYLFYMSLCCSFFPAPTAWIVLLMASPMVALVQGGWGADVLTVVIVAAVGALGTTLANLNEYHIFTFLLRFGRAGKIRQARIYRIATRYFEVSPLVLMTAVSFLPIPVDVVRWLAITHRYRRDHFAAASFVGRFLRYAILAGAATCLQIGVMGIIIIQAALVVLVTLRYVPRILNQRRGETENIITAEDLS